MAFSITAIATNTNTTGATRTNSVPVGGVPLGSLVVTTTNDASNAAPGAGSVADAGGNTYTFQKGAAINGSNANGTINFFTAPVTTALTSGQLITYTKGVSGSAVLVNSVYVTGQDPTTPVDAAACASATGSSTTPSVTSGTPAVSTSFFMGAMGTDVVGATITQPGGSWTSYFNNTSTREGSGASLTGSGTATQTYNPTFASAHNWAAIILVISPLGGGGGANDNQFMLRGVG
jgi:hypothetical protein